MDDDGPTNVMTFLQVWRDVANKDGGSGVSEEAWTKALEAKGDENVVLEARFQMGQTPDLYRRCTTFPLAAAPTTPIHGFAFSQRAGQIGILMAMKGELKNRRVDYYREVRKLLKYVDWVYKQESIREFLNSKLGESDNEQAKLMLKNLQEGGLMTFKDDNTIKAQTKAVHILIEIMGPVLQQTAVIKAWMKQLAMHGINLGRVLSKSDVPNKIKYLEKVDSFKLDTDSFGHGIANICIALGMCALPIPMMDIMTNKPKQSFTSKQPTREARGTFYGNDVDGDDDDFDPTLEYDKDQLPKDKTMYCQWTPIVTKDGSKRDQEQHTQRASALAQVSVLSAIHKWAKKNDKGETAAAAKLLMMPHLCNIQLLGQQPEDTLTNWYTSPITLSKETFYLAPLSWDGDGNEIYISTRPSLLKAKDADVKAIIEKETAKAKKAKEVITEKEKKAAVAAALAAAVSAARTEIETEAEAKIQKIQENISKDVSRATEEATEQLQAEARKKIQRAKAIAREKIQLVVEEEAAQIKASQKSLTEILEGFDEERTSKLQNLQDEFREKREEYSQRILNLKQVKEKLEAEIKQLKPPLAAEQSGGDGSEALNAADTEEKREREEQDEKERDERIQKAEEQEERESNALKELIAEAQRDYGQLEKSAGQSLLAGLHVHSSTGVDIGGASSLKDDAQEDAATNPCLVYQTANLKRSQPDGDYIVTPYAGQIHRLDLIDPELTVQVFDTLIHILHKLTQLDAEEAAVEERIKEFESNTDRMRPTEEVEAKRRKTLVWEDATRSAALSGDRLYSFFRQLSGTAGESMNAVVQIDDAQYQRDVARSREQATKLSAAASERFAGLIESTFAGLFRQSGLTFAIGSNPTQEVQIISGNLRKQLTDLATSEVGGLFSKSVELEQLIESAKGKLTLAELVQQLRSIGEVLQQSTYMAAYQPNSSLSIETISQPQNSLVLNVRDVATAAINIAYDNLERELHYHYHRMRVPNLYELIEGRDVGMSNAFATLCAHVMVQQRLHAGAAAAYVTKWSASANARMLGVALKKAVEAVCSYTSRFKPPGVDGRKPYFEQT